MKDKQATTRQWLSVPRLEPERALEVVTPELACSPPPDTRTSSASDICAAIASRSCSRANPALRSTPPRNGHRRPRGPLARLAEAGVANRFGDQRFGRGRRQRRRGLAILRGERSERDRRKRRFCSRRRSRRCSIASSSGARRGGLAVIRAGDVLQKIATGGLFVSKDAAADQPRVDAGELVPTGPAAGRPRARAAAGHRGAGPRGRGPADAGATRDDFARAGRDLPGARRPVVIAADPRRAAVALEPAFRATGAYGCGSACRGRTRRWWSRRSGDARPRPAQMMCYRFRREDAECI